MLVFELSLVVLDLPRQERVVELIAAPDRQGTAPTAAMRIEQIGHRQLAVAASSSRLPASTILRRLCGFLLGFGLEHRRSLLYFRSHPLPLCIPQNFIIAGTKAHPQLSVGTVSVDA